MKLSLCTFKNDVFAFVNEDMSSRTEYFFKEDVEDFLGKGFNDPGEINRIDWKRFLIQTKRDIQIIDEVKHCVNSLVELELNLYDGDIYMSMADAAKMVGISRQLLKKYVNMGKFPSPDATQHETRELWLKKNISLYQRGLHRKNLGEMVATYPLHHFNTVKGLLRKYPLAYVEAASNDLYVMKDGDDREPVKVYDFFRESLLN